MTKIYLYCVPAYFSPNDVLGFAVGEDGKGLTSHLSSNIEWSKYDMGLTSDRKHDFYKKRYPEGYTLEWVDDIDNHDGLMKALKLNEEQHEKENEK